MQQARRLFVAPPPPRAAPSEHPQWWLRPCVDEYKERAFVRKMAFREAHGTTRQSFVLAGRRASPSSPQLAPHNRVTLPRLRTAERFRVCAHLHRRPCSFELHWPTEVIGGRTP